ncbi:50S ribosomal protein L15 [Capsicum annuum]|nr:50S ribosomal protein L15 [Capsicum annuum]
MASLLSISSAAPSTTTNSLIRQLSSSFKGNTRNLKPSSNLFPSIKFSKSRTRTPFVIVNQASSFGVPSADSGTGSVRFRLNNLGPQPGATKNRKRKGRGHSAGQGGSCGFGMRGQKSRSGPGVRKGFEGGQMPLYRRLPKLRGIAGGMHAGLPKYLPVNLKDIAEGGFQEGEEVSLESLKQKGLINPSGRERRLPLKVMLLNLVGYALLEPRVYRKQPLDLLKVGIRSVYAQPSSDLTCGISQANETDYVLSSLFVSSRFTLVLFTILGDGELSVKLNFKARAFSSSAKEKLEAAGSSLTVLPGRKKWVKPSVAKNLARAEEYFAKKKAAASDSAEPSSA